MVEFRELRITNDSKYIIVDAAIKKDAYFENMIIKEIAIEFIDEKLETHGLYAINVPDYIGNTESYDEGDEITVSIKYGSTLTSNKLYNHIRLVFNQNTIPNYSLSKGVFIIHVAVEGTPSPEMPVGYANKDTKGIVVNMYSLYKNYIKKIQQLNSNCCISKDLISDILEMKTLEISAKLGDSEAVAKYWYLFNNTKCNCYGRT